MGRCPLDPPLRNPGAGGGGMIPLGLVIMFIAGFVLGFLDRGWW